MVRHAYGITVEWIHRTRDPVDRDRYNNPQYSEVSVLIPGVVVWPRVAADTLQSDTAEATGETNRVTDAITAFIPEGYAPQPHDALLVFDGFISGRYEVEGRAKQYHNPFTNEFVQVLNAVRVTG